MKFDQLIKHNFDQTPKLLETFDQLIRSSEIRSSDHFLDVSRCTPTITFHSYNNIFLEFGVLPKVSTESKKEIILMNVHLGN